MVTAGDLVLSALSMGGIGLLLAIGLVIADKKFRVYVDPKLEKIQEALPGINCGACGFPGCSGLADSIFKEESGVGACPVGGAETAAEIASIMGVEEACVECKKAVVECNGGIEQAKESKEYFGVGTCAAAHITGGGKKTCSFGCLGYGDCTVVCPFDAIHIDSNQLPVVDRVKCTGCGKCVEACPRMIIALYPEKHRVFVYCKSQDKGAVCRKYCTVSCIGCGICVKECKFEAIEVKNNLAVIDYDKCKHCSLCAKKCPTGAIGVMERAKKTKV